MFCIQAKCNMGVAGVAMNYNDDASSTYMGCIGDVGDDQSAAQACMTTALNTVRSLFLTIVLVSMLSREQGIFSHNIRPKQKNPSKLLTSVPSARSATLAKLTTRLVPLFLQVGVMVDLVLLPLEVNLGIRMYPVVRLHALLSCMLVDVGATMRFIPVVHVGFDWHKYAGGGTGAGGGSSGGSMGGFDWQVKRVVTMIQRTFET